MNASQCDCLELSTQEDDNSFTQEGDFCRKNSARLLCSQMDTAKEMCTGTIACDLKDFLCPRLEYNKADVPLRGLGNECNSCAMTLPTLFGIPFVYVASAFVYYLRL